MHKAHKAVMHYVCPMLTTPLEPHQTSLTRDPPAHEVPEGDHAEGSYKGGDPIGVPYRGCPIGGSSGRVLESPFYSYRLL